CLVCFFFQAEDGIRAFHVTGVQTCALPISKDATLLVSARRLDFGSLFETIEELDIGNPVLRDVIVKSVVPISPSNTLEVLLIDKIGRASCRERVWSWMLAGSAEQEN